jgi:predicted site-specific integrase-resolvase
MDTENARVTRREAAELAGVSERTINRWSERGLIRVWHDPKFRAPAQYDAQEVLTAALRTTVDVPLPPPETDISG